MAIITFSNAAVDMRLEDDGFGIVPIESAYEFLSLYSPVDAYEVSSSSSYIHLRAYDADYDYVNVHLWLTGQTNSTVSLSRMALEIEETGFYTSISGNMTINNSGSFWGAMSGISFKNADSGLTYLTASGLGLNFSGSEYDVGALFSLSSVLSGSDSITGGAYSDYIQGYGGSDTISGGAGNDFLEGSSGNDLLRGDSGNDTLSGGTGADTMLGGSGNDTYYVHATGDKVYETTTTTGTSDAGGSDTVYSYLASYTLGSYVENGRIMSAGVANLTGNSLSNTLYAGKGDNVLAGGSGTDTLSYAYGANGTMGVKVSLTSTAAQATGGSGTDTLSGFERLTGSANNDSLTGNSAANILKGGSGNDSLNGGSGTDTLYGDAGNDLLRGGAGNDILTGGTGQDLFRFDTALGTNTTSNIDEIRDFVAADDTIQLENSIFTKFGTATTGALSASYFKAIATGGVSDSNDYVVYNKTTGALYYDADGGADGNADGIQFALLGPNLTLTAADFVLV